MDLIKEMHLFCLGKRRTSYITFIGISMGCLMSGGMLSATPVEKSTSYTYHPSGSNGAGQLATINGPRIDVVDVTSYAYDAYGNLISITDPLGHIIQYSNYDERGLPGKVIDANGVETVLAYNPRGWLTSSTSKDPGGNSSLDAISTFDYDAVGQVTRVTLPDNSYLDYEYDDARRLKAIQNNLLERIEYTVDAGGNRTQEIIKNSSSTIVQSRTRVFDELSRLMDDIGAGGQTTHYDYDTNDNPTQITDAKTNTTLQAFDALNRLKTETDPDLHDVGYTYDDQDRIKTVTDQRGLVTTYHYDAFGNLTSLVSPDTGTTNYEYDEAGNRTKQTDARGVVVDYTYDALNRLLTINYPADSSENITYTYDDTQNGNYGKGRLTGITDESGSTNFTYDHRGNLVEKSYTIELTNYLQQYSYDLANKLVQITYPSGRIVEYSRDSGGRVSGITTKEDINSASEPVISNVGYLPFGPISSYTYANGMTHSISYDQDYRVTDIESLGTFVEFDLNYGYDANSNIASLVDQEDPGYNQTFQYDKLNRLEQAIGNYGQLDYQYDGVGNRTQLTIDDGSSITTQTYQYNTASNQLDQVDSVNGATQTQRDFAYASNGNVIQDTRDDGTVLDLNYNKANRYNALTKDSVLTAGYLYNALGQRVVKTATSPATDQHYHYDQGGQLLAVQDNLNAEDREYIYLGGIKVAMVAEATAAGNQSPDLEISDPVSGSVYLLQDSVTFIATANDPEDGDISANISWDSDLDGSLGSGAQLSTTSLSAGAHQITASVTDSGGTVDTANITVTVNEPGISFTEYPPNNYGGSSQNPTGTVTVESNGFALHLTGNRWQQIAYPYTVTANTVIEFDFESASEGELHGVGFDNNTSLSLSRLFKVYGTQNLGNRDFDNYPGSGVTRYVIPVGQHYTGSFNYIFFSNDHDVSSPDGDSVYSNVRVYEQP